MNVVTTDNRSFMYGDGLFETIRVRNGVPLFATDHFQRLINGLRTLGMDQGPCSGFEGFMSEVQALIPKENQPQARIRIQVSRKKGGYYTPAASEHEVQGTYSILESADYQTGPGIRLTLFSEQPKAPGLLSPLKTTSSLLYVMAGSHAANSHFDDAFLVNPEGNVIESSRANLFLLKGDRLITPPLSEGCLDGVMRKQVMQLAKSFGFQVQEAPVTVSDACSAEELWLTNVIQGISYVSTFQGQTFSGKGAEKFTELFNRKLNSL